MYDRTRINDPGASGGGGGDHESHAEPEGAGLLGRDPRRLFTLRQRTEIRTRQAGRCAVCAQPLPDDFHVHHAVPWAARGATVTANGVAVCPGCHAVAPTVPIPTLTLRRWQELATDSVLPILRTGGFATVAAAPGAGKTLFAVHIATQLAASGHIERPVVVVPTTHLRSQWAETCATHGIHLDPDPRGGIERRGYTGAVLTYAALAVPETVDALARSVEDIPTLLILDECHHLATDEDGDHQPWARSIARIVGDPANPRAAVLNLSGTPFRSRTDQRIATIAYDPVADSPGKVQARCDFEVPASVLIDGGELRHIDLYTFNAGLQVVPLRGPEAGSGTVTNVVDLADRGRAVRSAALNAFLRDVDNYVDPQLDEMLEQLRQHQHVLNGATVKGLIVADDANHADLIYSRLEQRIGRHATVVHSKTDDPHGDLRRFRNDPDPAVLVSVRMVAEGYDVPEITTIVHATRWTAPLFVNQVVARAMRITQAERAQGLILPAVVMVPADSDIVAAYSDVMVNTVRLLDTRASCAICRTSPCQCRPTPADKQCRSCGMPWRHCACLCGDCGGSRSTCGCPRTASALVDVEVVSAASLHAVAHDGQTVARELIDGIDWASAGVPPAFIPSAAAAVQAKLVASPYDLAAAVRNASTRPGGTP